ncbi:response regulator [Cryomorpha ignava]|uniref:Response regulator n=1 Tax=Cryomorpha ignava TaxID=101383 RepID=A0A7K3WRD3_9FLAO|nr:response regulator [Cryomorpha ignava]NEN24239.1 response regulator [Cryomorpha ignava]
MKKFKSTLIIDDDPISCFINQKIIERTELTQHIAVVHNGAEALEYIVKDVSANSETGNKPDLIFLDLNMPGMDGFEFLQKYKALERNYWENVEIVVLTSSNNQTDINKTKGYNVMAYLTKPLTVESLNSLFKQEDNRQ